MPRRDSQTRPHEHGQTKSPDPEFSDSAMADRVVQQRNEEDMRRLVRDYGEDGDPNYRA